MWLYVPSTSSRSAPASACSTKDCARAWGCLDSRDVLSFTLKGKPLPPRSLRRLWKRAAWSQRLFGTISRPSTAGRGAAWWMASLRASPANRTRLRDNNSASMTRAGSGPTSHESFARANLHLLSSKTCLDFFTPPVPSTPYLTLPKSGSMRSGVISKRPPLALPTLESVSSFWPTSRASDGDKGGPNQMGSKGDPMLPSAAAHWATPDANTATYSNGEFGPNIRQQAAMWATPDACLHGGSNKSESKNAAVRPNISMQSKLWATPQARDEKSADSSESGNYQRKQQQGFTIDLNSQASNWPTPTARIVKGGGVKTTRKDGKSRMDMLDYKAEIFSHPVHSIHDGRELSPTRRTLRPQLNPAFACWLMGWPIWWTNPGLTSCAQSEMPSYRCKLQRHLLCLLGEREWSEGRA